MVKVDAGQPDRLSGTPPGQQEIARRNGVCFGPVKAGLWSPASVYALALPCHLADRYAL
jgi:hypothetical protein